MGYVTNIAAALHRAWKALGPGDDPTAMSADLPFGLPSEDRDWPWGNSSDRHSQLAAYEAAVWVRTAVQHLANSCARIPLQARDKKTGEQFPDHLALRLIRQANPFEAQASLLRGIVSYRKLTGDAFLHVVRDRRGTPRELFLLPPHQVGVQTDPITRVKGYTYTASRHNYDIGVQDIVHFREWNGRSGVRGLSPIETIARSTGTDILAQKWLRSFFENGAFPAQVLTPTEEDLSKKQLHDVAGVIEKATRGASRAHRLIPLPFGLKLQKADTVSPKEAEFVDMRRMARDETGAIFGVPPILMGDYESASYSNSEAQLEVFWENTVLPLETDIVDSLNEFLIPQMDPDIELVIDSAAVRRLIERENDTTLRLNTLLQSGTITRNEARRYLGLPKSDDDAANELWIPVNLAPSGVPPSAAFPTEARSMGADIQAKTLAIGPNVQALQFEKVVHPTEGHVRKWLEPRDMGSLSIDDGGLFWYVELFAVTECVTIPDRQQLEFGVGTIMCDRSGAPSDVGPLGVTGPRGGRGRIGGSTGVGVGLSSANGHHKANGHVNWPQGHGPLSLVKARLDRERQTAVREMAGTISEIMDGIARKVARHQQSLGEPSAESMGVDWDEESKHTASVLRRAKTKLIERVIRRTERRLRSGSAEVIKQGLIEDDLADPEVAVLFETDPAIIEELGDLVEEHSDSITVETRSEIATVLKNAVDAKMPLGQVVESLMAFAEIHEARALNIAMTEAGSAYNSANAASLRFAGSETKVWLTLGAGRSEPRERHSQEENDSKATPVPIDQPFPNTGLDRPLDPSGPAKEVVNCRCTMLSGDPDLATEFVRAVEAEVTKEKEMLNHRGIEV